MSTCPPVGNCTGWAFPPFLQWTTVPSESEDLGVVAIMINVLFSLAPTAVNIYALVFVTTLVLDGRNGELYLKGEIDRTLANSQLALKYLFYSILVPLLNFVQKSVLELILPCSWLRRPTESCLSSNGMPDEWSVWGGGMFTLFFIDLMMRWSVPHLTMVMDDVKPVYTKQQMRKMGYTEISAQWMVQALLVSILTLGPVPLSRYVVRDATYFQVLLGLLEGMLLALVLHVQRVRMLDGDADQRFQMYQKEWMVRGGCFTLAVRGKWGELRHHPPQELVQHIPAFFQFRKAMDEAKAILEDEPQRPAAGSPQGSFEQPLLDAERGREEGSPSAARAQKRWYQWRCPSDVPGLEFMGLSIGDLMRTLKRDHEEKMKAAEQEMEAERTQRSEEHQQKLAEMAQEQEEKEREGQEQLKKTQEEADAKLAKQEEEQRALMEKWSTEHKQQLERIAQEKAQREKEAEEQLQRMRAEAEETLAKQKKDQQHLLEQRQEEHKKDLERMNEEREREKEAQKRARDEEDRLAQQRLQEQREENERKIKEAEEEHRRNLEQKKREAQAIQEAFEGYQKELQANAESLSILQTARDEGDMQKLGVGLNRPGIRKFLEDDAQGTDSVQRLFKPVAKLAKDVYSDWKDARERFHTEKRKCESAQQQKMQDQSATSKCIDSKMAGALFNSYVTCVEKGLVLAKDDTDKKACEEVEKILIDWARGTFARCSDLVKDETGAETSVHELIIRKAMQAQTQTQLGNFDATDLNACLQTVDRDDMKFKLLSLRQVKQVNSGGEGSRPVAHLTRALQQLSNLIFFLDYIGKEDLKRTYEQFKTSLDEHKAISKEGEEFKNLIRGWIADAQQNYQESATLLRREDLQGIENKDPSSVIGGMEQRALPGLDVFKDIFCMLARVWEQDFGVLVVPHHTQVVALLVFKAFLNNDDATLKTLIGQVSTGEGKSMLIASLALFVVGQSDKSKRKRVHVIGSDEKLVQRDFESFKGVFNEWRRQKLPELPEKDFAVVCAKRGQDVRPSIPDDSWIVYCEAKHISSYYTQKARAGTLDVKLYDSRVLIIDEVDALIVDKDPTDEFVYDIGSRTVQLAKQQEVKISKYTKDLALAHAVEQGMVRSTGGRTLQDLRPEDTASQSIFREIGKLVKQVKQWKEHPDEKYKDENGNWYGTDKNGHVNKDYKSNFLEVLRLIDKKSDDMCWFERQYVMSKPRVFQLYRRIIGFSGTVGNVNEQLFLAQAYGANFFIVPPFLKTCYQVGPDGKEKQLYFVAEWAPRSTWNSSLGGPAGVLNDEKEQVNKVSQLAFEARKKVPVLVITKDDDQVKRVTDELELQAAGLKLVRDDVVRPLNRTLYESNMRQYKENLRLSTRCYTSGTGKDKTWRITVTDPSGARGTDYVMDDEDADAEGGLLLIMMEVPLSERDWIQYKGRTARQKWKGQYSVLLNKNDYRGDREIDASVLGPLAERPDDLQSCQALIDAILSKGVAKSQADLDRIQAAYNAGFVANEVCERAWARFPPRGESVDIDLEEGDARSAFMRICRTYRYMQYNELVEEAKLISSDLFPSDFAPWVPNREYQRDLLEVPPKMVTFMYDVSYSMQGAVGATTRMGACKEKLESMLKDGKIIGDSDQVGVVAFGYGHKYLVDIGPGIRSKVQDLMQGPFANTGPGTVQCQNERPAKLDPAHPEDPGHWGLGKSTYFFSTLQQLLRDLLDQGREYQKNLWLIALTDGEPSDKTKRDATLECLSAYTKGEMGENNLIIITISADVKKESEVEFKKLTDCVQQEGGVGLYIAAKDVEDDTAIAGAFRNVAAALVDVSGMTSDD